MENKRDDGDLISFIGGGDTTGNEFYNDIIRDCLKKRVIVLNEEITDEVFEVVCLNILKWNAEDKHIDPANRRPIWLYINSVGGDILAGNQIIAMLNTSKTPIYTVAFGLCASMASYIFVSGKVRYCFPESVFLCHDGTTGYMTSGNKGRDIQKFYDKLDDKLKDLLIKRTKMETDFLEEIKDREYYIFSDEAKERGLVDKIIGIDCELEEILV